jgi:hypothetical protein
MAFHKSKLRDAVSDAVKNRGSAQRLDGFQ